MKPLSAKGTGGTGTSLCGSDPPLQWQAVWRSYNNAALQSLLPHSVFHACSRQVGIIKLQELVASYYKQPYHYGDGDKLVIRPFLCLVPRPKHSPLRTDQDWYTCGRSANLASHVLSIATTVKRLIECTIRISPTTLDTQQHERRVFSFRLVLVTIQY